MTGFRQSDLTKAIRAARRAGFELEEAVITPAGEIRLLRKGEGAARTPEDVRREIEGWARGKG